VSSQRDGRVHKLSHPPSQSYGQISGRRRQTNGHHGRPRGDDAGHQRYYASRVSFKYHKTKIKLLYSFTSRADCKEEKEGLPQ
ncbi:unnamed protein product, partial [Nesidiocoris tenuis]